MGSRSPAERLVGAIAIVVLAAACTAAPTEPEDVDDCSGLVAVGVQLVEGYLEVVEQLDVRVFTAEAPVPTELIDDLADLDRRSGELDSRIAALACDPADVRDRILERTAGIESEDLIGQILLRFVRDSVP